MNASDAQGELFGIVWHRREHPFRLRVNDVIRIDGKLCLVIRVTPSAAVVLMNRSRRKFMTRFDKPVEFQPSPLRFHISANSEVEILNREDSGRKKHPKTRKEVA